MSKAVISRMLGDDYQALYFWYIACELFYLHTKVKTISYEYDVAKAFDDVVVEYESPIIDERGKMIHADFYQIKFHVTLSGEMTCYSLIDPSFINAASVSFLQRLKNAVISIRGQGKECRFNLVTPWGIPAKDQLADLISNNGGELRLDKLMEGTTDNSRMGQIRKMWRDHLEIADDSDLYSILEPLRLYPNSCNIKNLIEQLNFRLISAGLLPIDNGSVTHKYADLIKGLLKKGRFTFTKEELLEWCKAEGLWNGSVQSESDPSINLGIRSFSRWAENMENETDFMLCLAKYFDGRNLKDSFSWKNDIMNNISLFIKSNVITGRSYNIHLDAHASIAFAAGYELDVKSGVDVAPVQKGLNGRKQVWRPDDISLTQQYKDWVYKECVFNKGNDVAIAISVTHDISDDVDHYIHQTNLPVGRMISCFIDRKGPGATSVESANHALFLADRIATKIKSRTIIERMAHLHIFFAGPNGLMFFIGRHSKYFGSCTVYEYEQIPGRYQPAITFSI